MTVGCTHAPGDGVVRLVQQEAQIVSRQDASERRVLHPTARVPEPRDSDESIPGPPRCGESRTTSHHTCCPGVPTTHAPRSVSPGEPSLQCEMLATVSTSSWARCVPGGRGNASDGTRRVPIRKERPGSLPHVTGCHCFWPDGCVAVHPEAPAQRGDGCHAACSLAPGVAFPAYHTRLGAR